MIFIPYAVVSLPLSTTYIQLIDHQGYVIGAIANLRMLQRLGFGTVMLFWTSLDSRALTSFQTLVIGAVLQMIAFVVQAIAPPFPIFAAVYILPGFGVALQVCEVLKAIEG